MPTFKRLPDVQAVVDRIRKNQRRWGISAAFLARHLKVTRQYAWQIVHYRTPLSVTRAVEIEGAVERIIGQRLHLRTFGDRLRAARLSAGLTLREVAGMIGYTWVGVERWEKNICRPKPGVLWHLCMVYEIPINAIDMAAGTASTSSALRPGIRRELAESFMSDHGFLQQATERRSATETSPPRGVNSEPYVSKSRIRAA
jgi:transcriptional regulator with XRE-family HTH domain